MKDKKEEILIGRHCLLKSPHFLLGAVEEIVAYEGNCFMIYLGSPQNIFRQPLEKLKIEEFKNALGEKKIDIENVVVHAPYLINLARKNDNGENQWAINFLKNEIKMMKNIGLRTLIIHPGNSLNLSKEEALKNISQSLNAVLKKDDSIRIAIETMSGKGSEMGINFDEIREIISKVSLKEKIGVCWDTCHLFCAGYDIKDKLDGVIEEFDKKLGVNKLWVIHVNDSVYGLGEKKDRHENIGLGKIGLTAIKELIYHPKLRKKINILETPRKSGIYLSEIKALKKFDLDK